MPASRSQPSHRVLLVWLMLWLPIGIPLILHPAPDGWLFLGSWAALLAAGATAYWRGWGWMVPCALWGVTFGWLANPAFSGASIRPAWETLSPIIGGAALGLVAGMILDAAWPRASDSTS